MVKEGIIRYIYKGRKRGFSYQRLKQELLNNNFKERDIDEAIVSLRQAEVSEKGRSNKKPSGKNDFKDSISKEKSLNKKEIKEEKKGEVKKEKPVKEGERRVSNKSLKKVPKKRKAGIVLLLSIITLGIYGIVWLVKTTKELRENTETAPKPSTLWLLLIPIVNAIVMIIYLWKYSSAVNELTGFSKGGLFALWIFVGPVAMVLTQLELNKLAESK